MLMIRQSRQLLLLAGIVVLQSWSTTVYGKAIDNSFGHQTQRDLVTIHLYINDVGEDSSSWSTNGVRNCGSYGTSADTPTASTVVYFTYNVETNSSNPGAVQDTIERRLRNLIVNSVADRLCSSQRRNLRALPFSSSHGRRLGLETVDGTTPHEDKGTCTPEMDASRSCNSYAGSLQVAYSETTEEQVTRNVLTTIKTNMDNGAYKNTLNKGLRGSGVMVTNVKFTSRIPTPSPPPPRPPPPAPVPKPVPPAPYTKPVPPAPYARPSRRPRPEPVATAAPVGGAAAAQTNNYSSNDDRGLSRTGKILVPIAALLLLLLLLLLCCWMRHRAIMRRRREEEAEAARRLAEMNGMVSKSIPRDNANDDASTVGHSEDGDSYLSTDMNDLGKYHSKLDVHKCTSATCRACNPTLSEGPPPTVAQLAQETAPSTPPTSPDDEHADDDDDDDDDDSTRAQSPPPPPPPQRPRGRSLTRHPIMFLKVASPSRSKSRRSNSKESI